MQSQRQYEQTWTTIGAHLSRNDFLFEEQYLIHLNNLLTDSCIPNPSFLVSIAAKILSQLSLALLENNNSFTSLCFETLSLVYKLLEKENQKIALAAHYEHLFELKSSNNLIIKSFALYLKVGFKEQIIFSVLEKLFNDPSCYIKCSTDDLAESLANNYPDQIDFWISTLINNKNLIFFPLMVKFVKPTSLIHDYVMNYFENQSKELIRENFNVLLQICSFISEPVIFILLPFSKDLKFAFNSKKFDSLSGNDFEKFKVASIKCLSKFSDEIKQKVCQVIFSSDSLTLKKEALKVVGSSISNSELIKFLQGNNNLIGEFISLGFCKNSVELLEGLSDSDLHSLLTQFQILEKIKLENNLSNSFNKKVFEILVKSNDFSQLALLVDQTFKPEDQEDNLIIFKLFHNFSKSSNVQDKLFVLELVPLIIEKMNEQLTSVLIGTVVRIALSNDILMVFLCQSKMKQVALALKTTTVLLAKKFSKEIAVLACACDDENLYQTLGDLFSCDPYTLASEISNFLVSYMVYNLKHDHVQNLAKLLSQSIETLITNNLHTILYILFTECDTDHLEQSKAFLISLISAPSITFSDLIRSCSLRLITLLVFEMYEDSRLQKTVPILELISLHIESSENNKLLNCLNRVFLGVIFSMNESLLDNNISLDKKKKIAISFQKLLFLIKPSITTFSSQIFTALKTASENKDLLELFLPCWEILLENIEYEPKNTSFVVQIIGCILSFENSLFISNIVQSCLVRNFTKLDKDLVSVLDIPDKPEFELIKDFISSNCSLVDLWSLAEFLDVTNLDVLLLVLRKISKHLESTSSALLKKSESIGKQLCSLQSKLISICNSARSDKIILAATECISIIGALDPDRFLNLDETDFQEQKTWRLQSKDSCISFSCYLIENRLVPLLRSSTDNKFQDRIAFTIQELSKFCEFSNGSLQENQNWLLFSSSTKEVVKPLIKGKYSMSFSSHIPSNNPNCLCFPPREWIVNWLLNLIENMGETLKSAFIPLRAVFKVDFKFALEIFSTALVSVFFESGVKTQESILLEFIRTLELVTSNDSADPMFASILFKIFAELNTFNVKFNKDLTAQKDLKTFLKKIPNLTLAQAAFKCQDFTKSLYHFEQFYLESNVEENSKIFQYIQKIFSKLRDIDNIEGLSSVFQITSLEMQIVEHEISGNWSSAQACYECLIKSQPDNLDYQLGFIDCLKKVGLLETALNYIESLKHFHPEWIQDLESHQIEACWRLQKWDVIDPDQITKSKIDTFDASIARILLANEPSKRLEIISETKLKIGKNISDSYASNYNLLMQLHMLRDIDLLQTNDTSTLVEAWDSRLKLVSPDFNTREKLLNLHRSLLLLNKKKDSNQQVNADLVVGQLWLKSAKTARKANYLQTAYTAILNAEKYETPQTHIQKAKLFWDQGQLQKSLNQCKFYLENSKVKLIKDGNAVDPLFNPLVIGKTELLLGRRMEQAGLSNSTDIQNHYQLAVKANDHWEKGYFYLGKYQNKLFLADNKSKNSGTYLFHIIKNYGRALIYGTRFICQTLPRLLTLWLDYGATVLKEESDLKESLNQINVVISKLIQRVPAYQLLTAFPQIISRICHPNPLVFELLESMILKVLNSFPQQALWQMVSVSKSSLISRSKRCNDIFLKLKSNEQNLKKQILLLADQLITLSNFSVAPSINTISLNHDFRVLQRMTPLDIIVPLLSSFTINLPDNENEIFNSSSDRLPKIIGFEDQVEIISSLQRPKKIIIKASNGKDYLFLCKPKDDLRKDCRLMEFNNVINKLLKKQAEARKRQLLIRTYQVIPLNEECGLIEWVPNTVGFRNICLKIYQSKNLAFSSKQLKEVMALKLPPKQIFTDHLLPRYPPVFQEWFFESFYDSSKWLKARQSYTRTLAVMSIVGYILGLGDRHGENILFDQLTGDTIHVDFNCLFEKGLTFEKPEKVPFRLTRNLISALGITGYEGGFRKSCEITLKILRNNKDTLMTILETFIHDPLVEWSSKINKKNLVHGEIENELGLKSLNLIEKKLEGVVSSLILSVEGQVQELIQQATSVDNLSVMYVGWAPFM